MKIKGLREEISDIMGELLLDFGNEKVNMEKTIDQLLNLFTETMLGIIGEDEEELSPELNRIDIPFEDNDIIAEKNQLRQEMRSKLK